jgi:tRNA(fMet)-specific endonuclease VapC
VDVKLSVTYLIDTNTVAYIVDGRSKAARSKLEDVDSSDTVAISAITEAEIRYGLAKKPGAARWRTSVEGFLANVTILPWDSEAAQAYGTLRAALVAQGKMLSAMDMLIAAHASSLQAVLVTNDKAFGYAAGLFATVAWADDL